MRIDRHPDSPSENIGVGVLQQDLGNRGSERGAIGLDLVIQLVADLDNQLALLDQIRTSRGGSSGVAVRNHATLIHGPC